MSLTCAGCEESLLFSESAEWWVYTCGHLRCSAHAGLKCCGEAGCLANVMEDEVIYATCQYMRYLQPRNEGMEDCYPAAVASLMEIVKKKITLKINNVQQSMGWKCPVCLQTQSNSQSTCANCPPTEIFHSLSTLSLSRSLKGRPWVCPKPTCGNLNPPQVNKCDCGYVDLKRVEVNSPLHEPHQTDTKPTSTEAEMESQVWTCPHCKYEYNLTLYKTCQRCRQRKEQQNCQLI